MKRVKLSSLIQQLQSAATREQDMSIGDRQNYWQHAFNYLRLLGAADFVAMLKQESAELLVSEELAKKLNVEVEDVAA